MRARLLDMGEVSAARSQSIYHAIAAAMAPEDSPVAVLLRPASSLVSIGADRDAASEIDLELCLEDRIPVLRRLLGGAPRLLGENSLLFSFLRPVDRTADTRDLTGGVLVETCRSLGLPSLLGPAGEILSGTSGADTRQVGTSQIGTLEGSVCLAACLARDREPIESGSVLRLDQAVENGGYPRSSLAQELEDRPDFAAIAEALVEAIEQEFEVELVPSMPTPDEMDAIYEWDERLVLDLEHLARTAASREAVIN